MDRMKLESDVKVFGFWVYLMTDLIIFAGLFATFITLRHNTFGGPSGNELFKMKDALKETLILLASTFTCSIATLSIHREHKAPAIFWYLVTFCLGIAFLFFEIKEFIHLAEKGASWKRSGFLSSFFTLVGTHGTHVVIGLLWMGVECFRILLRPLSHMNVTRIYRMAIFGIFWISFGFLFLRLSMEWNS